MANDEISRSQTPRDILADLYESKLLADVTIQLKDRTIRAHRAILAKTSSWFADRFAKDPEYDSKLVINLPDDDVTAMEAMICFCYTGEYSYYLKKDCCAIPAIHFDVYIIAEKYNAASLRAFSLESFNEDAEIMMFFESDEVIPIIKKAYNHPSQSNTLRSAAVKIFNQYLGTFKRNSPGASWVARLRKEPDETIELLIQIAKDTETSLVVPKHRWKCSICKAAFEYTGEAKAKTLKGKMCPWCKAEEI